MWTRGARGLKLAIGLLGTGSLETRAARELKPDAVGLGVGGVTDARRED